MKKSKLFGSRLIENIQVPRTPKIIMFDSSDSIKSTKFEEGDILDANSIKHIVDKIGTTNNKPNTSAEDIAGLNDKLKALEKEINVLPIDFIEDRIGITNETIIDKFSGGIIYDNTTKKFYAKDGNFYYPNWKSYNKYPSSDVYNSDDTKVYLNISEGTLYRITNGILTAIASSLIHVGDTAPEDLTKLWIDTSSLTLLSNDEADEIKNIKSALTEIYKDLKVVNKLILHGAVAGNSTSSAREVIMDSADPINPKEIEETEEQTTEDQGIEPNKDGIEPTVNHISIKMDTATNFVKNRQNLIDGELLFYTDRKKIVLYKDGTFNVVGNTGSGSGQGGISVEDLYATQLDYLKFTDGSNEYKVYTDSDGNFNVQKISTQVTNSGSKIDSWGVYISHLLCINEVYCGGSGSEDCMVSHNFVELANGSDNDINLNGILLLYTDGTPYGGATNGYKWNVLPLTGIIKAGSTYLVRGAKCNNYNSEFITVGSYDQEWLDGDSPIQFSLESSSFYLCVGDLASNWVYDVSGNLLNKGELASPWSGTLVYQGYIDSCGFGTGSLGEGGSTFILASGDSFNNALFVRNFMLEPAKLGNKAYNKRKTTALWTYIDLKRQTVKSNNTIKYYYTDDIKQSYTPKASWEGKNFFTNKTRFNRNRPNSIRCTFGIQATSDNLHNVLASRCFNWVSVGYYDEFIQYRKKGTNDWTTIYSITEGDSNNTEDINHFIDHYKRFRWKTASGDWVTTHKVVLKNKFDTGVYEYRVGRDDDEYYYSKIKEFTVKDNSEVNTFTFVQETDEQGFSWQEYQAWRKSAKAIRDNETFDFLINTGDITQSGNRENEWLDYYKGLDEFLGDKEEMFTIGNNDLCGHNSTQLTNGDDVTSKYNHINVLRYFTFELDPNNDYSVEWKGNTYPIYSLYSFNYGNFHFISLNSENAAATSKVYTDNWELSTNTGDASFASSVNAKIEDWLKKDLQIWKDTSDEPTDCGKAIIYMHEMPFTMVTWDFMSGSKGREGSHLNTLNNNGAYRFSRLFKKYGIRCVLGGHKHTFTISKPIYDAPSDYITPTNTVSSSDLMGDVTTEDSRKPVIQVLKKSDINPTMSNFARYEVVNKITAPTYIMSLATGYKLVSNKEMPSGDQYPIPWLLSYFKAASNSTSPKENVRQHYPMYIVFDIDNNGSIKATAKQINGVWNVNVDNSKTSYDMNKLMSNLSVTSMTLDQSSDEDKSAYNITDTKSYTITL